MRRQQTVWVCRVSGTVFLDREEFREHLLARRAKQHYASRRARIIAAADAFAAECETIEQLENWLNTSSFFLDMARLTDRDAAPTLANFRFRDIRAGNPRNSHSAPRGLAKNWNRNPGLPLYYPGIDCIINFTGSIANGQFNDLVTDFLGQIGIRTGTGGGGPEAYRYSCIIWAQHFPKLYRNLIARDVARQLGFNTSAMTVSVHETR